MTILTAINKAASDLLSSTGKFSERIVDKVVSVIQDALQKKKAPKLEKADVKKISDQLKVNRNRGSIYTWLRQECFNRLIMKLRNIGVLDAPYIINPAQRRQRDLIAFFPRHVLQDAERATLIRQYLLDFSDSDDFHAVSLEAHLICSYVSSAILFGHVFYNSCYKDLLSVTLSRISPEHNFLLLPLKDSPVYYRFSLPFHAAVRLNQCRLYYRKMTKAAQAGVDSDVSPALPLSFPLSSFPTLFRSWSAGVLQASGDKSSQGISLSAFCKSARILSALDTLVPEKGLIILPPFIHAVHSRSRSKCFSFDDVHLYPLLGNTPGVAHRTPNNTINHVYKITNPAIAVIIAEITKVRRGIMKSKSPSKNKLAAFERISMLVEKAEHLAEHDRINLRIFVHWISMRFRAGSKINTINDYASILASFVDILSSMGKSMLSIVDSDMIVIFKQLKTHYGSPAIKSRIRDIMEFSASEYTINISDSIWSKKDMRLPDVLMPKPLVTFDHITAAGARCLEFLASRLYPSGNQAKIDLRMQSASLIHKAKHLRHAFSLSFFGGLRRKEVLSTRASDIYIEAGPLLHVAGTKTRNSERYIPMWLLFPDEYLAEFMSFVRDRVQSDGPGALLFVNESGQKWDPKEFTECTQDLFISLGFFDFVYHCFRMSFGSWFLLKWFKVFYKTMIPPETPFLKYELFDDKYDSRFRQLFLGCTVDSRGSDDFTHALFVLARLLGHGGPRVTVERYTHTVCWIDYLLMRHYDFKEVSLTSKQGSYLLQTCFASLPAELHGKGRKTVPATWLLLEQISKISKLQPIGE